VISRDAIVGVVNPSVVVVAVVGTMWFLWFDAQRHAPLAIVEDGSVELKTIKSKWRMFVTRKLGSFTWKVSAPGTD
jgi:hypothetical protein